MADKGKRDISEWDPDPVHRDESDPEFREDLYNSMLILGTKPEDILDLAERADYVNWVAKNPNGTAPD